MTRKISSRQFLTKYHPFRSEKDRDNYLGLYDERARNWPVPSETRMVETSYGSTHIRISGPESAPNLVLLHGAGGNSLHWIPNIEDFSQKHRVFAIDNIYDNGRSIYIKAIEGPEDYVSWLDEVCSLFS